MNLQLKIGGDKDTSECMPDYVMGVDPYGYDNKTGSICIIRKDGVVEYLKSMKHEDVELEIKRLASFYNIPENYILRETK